MDASEQLDGLRVLRSLTNKTLRPEKKLSPSIRDARHFVLAMHSFSETNDENFRTFQDIFDARHFNFF